MPKGPRGEKRAGDDDEDEAQSQRFIELAHELEAKGELSPDDDGGAVDRLLRKVAPPRCPKAS